MQAGRGADRADIAGKADGRGTDGTDTADRAGVTAGSGRTNVAGRANRVDITAICAAGEADKANRAY